MTKPPWTQRPIPLSETSRFALTDAPLARDVKRRCWVGKSGRHYQSKIVVGLRDRGLLQIDLETDPYGRLAVPAGTDAAAGSMQ